MIGFVYADEPEAEKFFRKVDSKKISLQVRKVSQEKENALSKGKIDKSMISSPQIRFLQAHRPHGLRRRYKAVIGGC